MRFLMTRAFLFIFLLILSLLTHAGEEITPENPLYKFSKTKTGLHRNKFKIDYQTLVDYFSYVSQGLIVPSDSQNLMLKDNTLIDEKKEQLVFEVNLRKMHISPALSLAPESAQDLFNFNIDAYIAHHGGADFISAKRNDYKKLSFNKETQRFNRDFLNLGDWKSLNHPPIKKLEGDLDKFYKDSHDFPAKSDLLTSSFHKNLDDDSATELTTGNDLKLLVNNASYFEKLAQIKKAKRSIFVGVMSFASDPSSFALIDALIEKKKEGLDVQIILEKLWTTTVFRKTMKKITKGGIKLMLANDMFRLLKKNRGLFHNKIWIFDEEVAIVGGQNIVNSSNKSTGFNHWNKDTDVLIKGPMVTDILKEFIVLKRRYDERFFDYKNERFNLNTGESAEFYEAIVSKKVNEEKALGLRGQENYDRWFQNQETATNGTCRFVIQGPQKDKHAISRAYIKSIEAAQDHVYFVSQHIEYDTSLPEKQSSWETEIYKTIFNRGKQGVRFDLIANGIDGGFAEIGQNILAGKKNNKAQKVTEEKIAEDMEIEDEEAETFWTKLSAKLGLRSTKTFAKYLDHAAKRDNFSAWMHFQYIHSKTMLIDNIMASVGSFNFEPYSAESSHESSVFCLDRRLAKELKADLVRDIVNSTPVFPSTMVSE
jgi:phosphatidylserine/phosphatidylglycerophosphate/cardiolipin synthase-like enzyme